MKKYLFLLFLISLFAAMVSGCSLKYEKTVAAEENNPEFIFSDAALKQVEDGKVTVSIEAAQIEQYKNKDDRFAQDVTFKSFDKDGLVDSEGRCGFILADTKRSEYEMYDDIELYSKKHNAYFYSDVIKWNSKTEQFISGRNKTVKVIQDDVTMMGSGFSASGVTGSYQFTGAVSGTLEEKESKSQGDNQ